MNEGSEKEGSQTQQSKSQKIDFRTIGDWNTNLLKKRFKKLSSKILSRNNFIL